MQDLEANTLIQDQLKTSKNFPSESEYNPTYNDIEPRLSQNYLWTMIVLCLIMSIYSFSILYRYKGRLTRISKLLLMSCFLVLTTNSVLIIAAKLLVGSESVSSHSTMQLSLLMNSTYTVEIFFEVILAYMAMNMNLIYLGLTGYKSSTSLVESRIKCLWISDILFTTINLAVIQCINLYFCFLDSDEQLDSSTINMVIFYYIVLGIRWTVLLYYLWKGANIFALYTCHLLKLQKNMHQGVLAFHMGMHMVLSMTTITRDIAVLPPSMLAAIQKMDTKSSFIQNLYQNTGEDAGMYLSYTILAKNYFIVFLVLTFINLSGIYKGVD